MIEKLLPNKSRCRRLQYEWLNQISSKLSFRKNSTNEINNQDGQNSATGSFVLDLGGVPNAAYHTILKIPQERLIFWNINPSFMTHAYSSNPHQVVDLENTSGLPSFPENCSTVLLFNVLEHLYKPLDLLRWVCEQLPPKGEVVILVPFLYPIHPSPNDFWRMTPQVFERFFSDLSEQIAGQLLISPLGSDFREGTGLFTSSLFKDTKQKRLLATTLETAAWLASAGTRILGGAKQIQQWAENTPAAIGVLWTKD